MYVIDLDIEAPEFFAGSLFIECRKEMKRCMLSKEVQATERSNKDS